MSRLDYYFTRELVTKTMELDFLRTPQKASSEGGGLALLGTICEKAVEPFHAYPKPVMLTPAGIVLDALEARRKDIAIWHGTSPEKVQLETSIQLADVKLDIAKKHVVKLGADAAIPNVPVQFTLGFDFSLLKTMSISWKNASVIYMPIGNLQALYDLVNGDDTKVHPGGLLRKNFIVTSVLNALEYQVELTSEVEFDADFKIKAAAINDLGGNVKYTFTSKSSLSVAVKDDIGHVTALEGVRWRDVKIGHPS